MGKDCLFCNKRDSSIFESTSFFVLYDDFPVRRGHILLIPIRHVERITHLTSTEFCDLFFVIQEMVKHIEATFGTSDYNLGVNCGEVAGQTIPHVHIHLIPRYAGDVENPRGGIRKFLPNPLKEYSPIDD